MHTSFAGKKIVIGVTGSIAAFKVAGWVSKIAGEEGLVDVVMTDAATRFVSPITFSSLSGRPVYQDMFDSEQSGEISHISLGRDADCIVVAPASAQTISRLAQGAADNLLASTVLAARCPVLVFPAMNSRMYEHPATQKNISTLRDYGYQVIEPACGTMACRDEGKGRLIEWEEAAEHILRTVSVHDLAGQRVLVTAGPTREIYDPARFISNKSSGKMGYAIAVTAHRRGAEVTLVSGPVNLKKPEGIPCISVESAEEMYEAVMSEYENASVIVKAAAVSDFRCTEPRSEKVKKGEAELCINLEQTEDILKKLGESRIRERQLLVGFAAESSNIIAEGRRKLEQKQLDLIAVNDISSKDAGFAVDNNQLVLIDADNVRKLPHTTKLKTADLLWDHIVENGLLKTINYSNS